MKDLTKIFLGSAIVLVVLFVVFAVVDAILSSKRRWSKINRQPHMRKDYFQNKTKKQKRKNYFGAAAEEEFSGHDDADGTTALLMEDFGEQKEREETFEEYDSK